MARDKIKKKKLIESYKGKTHDMREREREYFPNFYL